VTLGELEAWWSEAFAELYAASAPGGSLRATRRRALPNGALHRGGRRERRVRAAREQHHPIGRVRRLEIPAVELAVALHEGALADADRTYGALGTYVTETCTRCPRGRSANTTW